MVVPASAALATDIPSKSSISGWANPSPNAGRLMLDCMEAAALLGVSRAMYWKLHSQARIPLPIRFGRVVRWRKQELEAWIAAGCPPRDRWDPIKMKVTT